MPTVDPVAIAGIVETYYEPEETRPGRFIFRPDNQDETVDLKIWLHRETRAKPNYLINLEATLGDVKQLEGQHIMVSARPSGEYEGRSQYNLVSVTIEKQPDATSVEPTTPAPTPAPQVALNTGWTPSQSDQWRADGAADGNAISNATAVILKYYDKNGERPSKQWMDEMADDINYQANAIRLGRTTTPEVEELPLEDNTPDDQGVMKV